ncbi:zinc-binding domain protein, partial [mine drainage metagenome]
TAKDEYDNVLRFVPELQWIDMDTGEYDVFPAIISRVQSSDGMTRAIHRTYLAKDGRGKAPVIEPKKMMARPKSVSLKTGAIRLGAAIRGVIAVAEGMETALAVRAFTGFACWSVVNSGLMRTFMPPEGVRGVHIFADLDVRGGGMEAAKALQDVLRAKGIQTRLDAPEGPVPDGAKSVDWLDVYNQYGRAAIQRVVSFQRARAGNVVQFYESQDGVARPRRDQGVSAGPSLHRNEAHESCTLVGFSHSAPRGLRTGASYNE